MKARRKHGRGTELKNPASRRLLDFYGIYWRSGKVAEGVRLRLRLELLKANVLSRAL